MSIRCEYAVLISGTRELIRHPGLLEYDLTEAVLFATVVLFGVLVY